MEKRIVIITGATSGIGKATAELFLKNDFFVVITGRREGRLKELNKKWPNSSEFFVIDIRRKTDVDHFIKFIEEKKLIPDILINNAGLAAGLAPAHEADWADWEQMIDTNVKGLLYLTHQLLPLMVNRKSGHIINVGSVAGKEVYPNGAVYCATKFAVEAITRGLRMDLLPHNIKVSSVSPGMVETEFSLVRFKGNEERAKKVYEGLTPLRPEDIAEAIYWIAGRPPHVHIQDIWIMPAAQASPLVINRN
ncbi:MAG: SDR family NAD(P)-dependent oxidoreductase [Bacteroidia bacterium]|nr:SDR family NAD(P)-dependent oxidoreductase [Bacteroidia bacterium]